MSSSKSASPAWMDERLFPKGCLGEQVPSDKENEFSWDDYEPPENWLEELSAFFKEKVPDGPDKRQILEYLQRHLTGETSIVINITKHFKIIYALMTKRVTPEEAGLHFNPNDDAAIAGTIRNLEEGLPHCAHGVFERTNAVCDRWASTVSLSGFLADYRRELVDTLARSRFHLESATAGLQTHRLNYYLVVANDIGLQIGGAAADEYYNKSRSDYDHKKDRENTANAITEKIKKNYIPIGMLQYIEQAVRGLIPEEPLEIPKKNNDEKSLAYEARLHDHNEIMKEALKRIFNALGKNITSDEDLSHFFIFDKVILTKQPPKSFVAYKEINWVKIRTLILHSLKEQGIVNSNIKINPDKTLWPPIENKAILHYWLDNVATPADIKSFFNAQDKATKIQFIISISSKQNADIKIIDAIGERHFKKELYSLLTLHTFLSDNNSTVDNYSLHLLCLHYFEDDQKKVKKVLDSINEMLKEPIFDDRYSHKEMERLIAALSKIEDIDVRSKIVGAITKEKWFETLFGSYNFFLPKLLNFTSEAFQKDIIQIRYRREKYRCGPSGNMYFFDLTNYIEILALLKTDSSKMQCLSACFDNSDRDQIIENIVQSIVHSRESKERCQEAVLNLLKVIPASFKIPLLGKPNVKKILQQSPFGDAEFIALMDGLGTKLIEEALSDKASSLLLAQACNPVIEVSEFPSLIDEGIIYVKKTRPFKSVKICSKDSLDNQSNHNAAFKPGELVLSVDSENKAIHFWGRDNGQIKHFEINVEFPAGLIGPDGTPKIGGENSRKWMDFLDNSDVPKQLCPELIYQFMDKEHKKCEKKIHVQFSSILTNDITNSDRAKMQEGTKTEFSYAYLAARIFFAGHTEKPTIWSALQTPKARIQYLTNIKLTNPLVFSEIVAYLFQNEDRLAFAVKHLKSDENHEYEKQFIELLGGIEKYIDERTKTARLKIISGHEIVKLLKLLPDCADKLIAKLGVSQFISAVISSAEVEHNLLVELFENLSDTARVTFLESANLKNISGMEQVVELILNQNEFKTFFKNILNTLSDAQKIDLTSLLAIKCFEAGKAFIHFSNVEDFLTILPMLPGKARSILIEKGVGKIGLEFFPVMTIEQKIKLLSLLSIDDKEQLFRVVIPDDLKMLFENTDKKNFKLLIPLLTNNILSKNMNFISNKINNNFTTVSEFIGVLKKHDPLLKQAEIIRLFLDEDEKNRHLEADKIDLLNIPLTQPIFHLLKNLEDLNFLFEELTPDGATDESTMTAWLKKQGCVDYVNRLFEKTESSHRYTQLIVLVPHDALKSFIKKNQISKPDDLIAILSSLEYGNREILLYTLFAENLDGIDINAISELVRIRPVILAKLLPLLPTETANLLVNALKDEIPIWFKDNKLSDEGMPCHDFSIILKFINNAAIKKQLIIDCDGIGGISNQAATLVDWAEMIGRLIEEDYDQSSNVSKAMERLVTDQQSFFNLLNEISAKHYPLILNSIDIKKYIGSADDLSNCFKAITDDRKHLRLVELTNDFVMTLLNDLTIDQLGSVVSAYSPLSPKNKMGLVERLGGLQVRFNNGDELNLMLSYLPEQVHGAWINTFHEGLAQSFTTSDEAPSSPKSTSLAYNFAATFDYSLTTDAEKDVQIKVTGLGNIAKMVHKADELSALLEAFPDDPDYEICLYQDNADGSANPQLCESGKIYLFLHEEENPRAIGYLVLSVDGKELIDGVLDLELDEPLPEILTDDFIHTLNKTEVLKFTSSEGHTLNANKSQLIEALGGMGTVVKLIEADSSSLSRIFETLPNHLKTDFISALAKSDKSGELMRDNPHLLNAFIKGLPDPSVVIDLVANAIKSTDQFLLVLNALSQANAAHALLPLSFLHIVLAKFYKEKDVLVEQVRKTHPELLPSVLLNESLSASPDKESISIILDKMMLAKPSQEYYFAKIFALHAIGDTAQIPTAFALFIKEIKDKKNDIGAYLINVASNLMQSSEEARTSKQVVFPEKKLRLAKQMEATLESHSGSVNTVLSQYFKVQEEQKPEQKKSSFPFFSSSAYEPPIVLQTSLSHAKERSKMPGKF